MIKFLGVLVAAGLVYRMLAGKGRRGNRTKTFTLAAERHAHEAAHELG